MANEKTSGSPLRVALYARFRNRSGSSERTQTEIDAQFMEGESWASTKSHEVVAKFADREKGANDLNRPGFVALMDEVKRRVIDVVWVSDGTRLYRGVEEAHRLERILGENDVRLVIRDEAPFSELKEDVRQALLHAIGTTARENRG